MQLYEKFPIHLANSLSGKKELFTPINSGHVGMYVCGPTVYNDVHLGNVRTFIAFDVMMRYFTHLGYKVRYVRNITDVGHLESEDEGSAEDKILKAARLEQLEPMEIAKRYTDRFHATLRQFNVSPPNIEPSATGHMVEQIEIIQKILDAGFAYEVNGSVYFDVSRYDKAHNYGILSGRVIEELMTGGRKLDSQGEKRNNIDFALWKKASSRHIMRWTSPWGVGFPGWHTECAAMSVKYLGKSFDLHGGGMDLKFPHHDCEIAQSMSVWGTSLARYWVHTNMLTVNGQKMSKSLGNSFLPHELISGNHPLIERGFSAMAVRFFMLQSHYSSTLDFSNEALIAAEKGYKKLMSALALLQGISVEGSEQASSTACRCELDRLVDDLYKNMSNDFNTAKVLATLFEMSTLINAFRDEMPKKVGCKAFDRFKTAYIDMLQQVLGLQDESTASKADLLHPVIMILAELRERARCNKNYALSDKIRDDLKNVGIRLKDGKDGRVEYSIAD